MTLKGPGDFSPPDDPAPTLMRCGCCGDEFSSEDVGANSECPECGEVGLSEVEYEPDFQEPDDDIDEAAAFGGRFYP